ncbi:hypothetical protein Pan241w_24240 [Gimesia alba]|uniref:Uncharacterized protein n=1 Tax=Gimesia alba TaxID=2527973 RepID=A0A517REP2_9PLAN|nr:hypothetical protein [Gimesia alba]QDT42341.1 hypothetical protein Pan241w_24240 [Gimesia alba]
MDSPFKFYLLKLSPVVCCLLILTLAIYSQPGPHRQLTPLESKVDQIPLGATRREVRKLIGSRHIATFQTTGVIVNHQIKKGPPKLLVRYGPPQDYSIRIWKQDGMHARIAFDESGKVVCRSVRSQSGTPRYHIFGPYSVFKHLRLMFLIYFI